MITDKTIDKLLQWASAAFHGEQHADDAAGRSGDTRKPFVTIRRQAGAKDRGLAVGMFASIPTSIEK